MSERRIRKAPPESATTGPMDVRLLEQIVKLMSANDLNTVEVRDGERRIMVQRGITGTAVYSAAPPNPAPAPPAAGSSGATTPAADQDANLIPIKSPMVGTFYAAPAKGSKPFVAVGASVDEDTDVCIIEAMKVFNNIKAECQGAIARILVQDGQPVEFGTILFLVKPA